MCATAILGFILACGRPKRPDGRAKFPVYTQDFGDLLLPRYATCQGRLFYVCPPQIELIVLSLRRLDLSALGGSVRLAFRIQDRL